jgi:hypothetical protein
MKKQFTAQYFSENVAREKLTKKNFYIYGESCLTPPGLRSQVPTCVTSQKNMVIVLVFTRKMIKHFKVGKYLCEVV